MLALFNNVINFYKNNRINVFTLIIGGFMSISGQKKKEKLAVPRR